MYDDLTVKENIIFLAEFTVCRVKIIKEKRAQFSELGLEML
jgi:ABC-type Na+ transport system ATPase subunit NatA